MHTAYGTLFVMNTQHNYYAVIMYRNAVYGVNLKLSIVTVQVEKSFLQNERGI
jgi:hypothetical protein